MVENYKMTKNWPNHVENIFFNIFGIFGISF
jgi:hypothetical protein